MNDSLNKRIEAIERHIKKTNIRGVVSEIDPNRGPSGCVKVSYGEGLVSDWLPVKPLRSAHAQLWWFPDVGEGVTVSHIENGEVTAGSYTKSLQPVTRNPDVMAMQFGDGGYIMHNRKTGELTINTNSKVNVITGNDVNVTSGSKVNVNTDTATVNAPNVNINSSKIKSVGAWTHQGTMNISGATQIKSTLNVVGSSILTGVVSMPSGFVMGSAGGGASGTAYGTINFVKGDIRIEGTSVKSHTHTDSEGGATSPPL